MLVYDGFHKVYSENVCIKGKERTIERLGIKDAVAALVVDAEGKMALVEQYRPCPDRYMTEIPAGLLDKPGLTIDEILIEELSEECGISKEEIEYISYEPIHSYYSVCGSSDAKTHIYKVCLNTIKESHRVLDDHDIEAVAWVDYDEVRDLYLRNAFEDPKTILAANYYMLEFVGQFIKYNI